jgi:hypothetical protein
MAITVKHSKVSAIPDGADTSVVRPSDWNADHSLVGTIDVANGGTGASTANGALTNLLPSQTGNNGKFLSTDGTNTLWSTNGSGDVVGPASATDNAIARFDATTGKLIQNSVVTVSDTGATTGITTLSASTSVTTPIVQATSSAGLALRNSAGTSQISMGAGGGDNVTIAVSTNLNGANAQIDISPTGTGHVHIKPTGVNSVEIIPTSVGKMDNVTIGATTAAAGSFTNLSVTGTTSFDGSQGTAGQVLTSAGTGNTPTWTTITGTGTVTSVAATVPAFLSVTGSPITTSGTLAITLSGTALPIANGGTGQTTANTAINALLPSQTGNNGKVLSTDGTNTSWIASGGSGTVTSVGQTFTGGIISVAGSPITTAGTLALTVAGTSGGIPYFSSATGWASSAALAASALVIGGGAGVAPSTITTGTGVTTALGVNTGTAGAFVVNGGALGTPSSGTLTNCTFPTLNQNTTGTASNVTGTVAVGNGGTGATTLTGLVVGNGTSAMTTVTAPSGAVVGTTDTQTLTNKRINLRVLSQTSTATLAINSDSYDQAVLTAQAASLAVSAPTGTPVNGQKLTIRIEDNGSGQAISWTTTSGGFRVIGTTLPTTTVATKVVYIGAIYNSDDVFWDVVSVAQQA